MGDNKAIASKQAIKVEILYFHSRFRNCVSFLRGNRNRHLILCLFSSFLLQAFNDAYSLMLYWSHSACHKGINSLWVTLRMKYLDHVIERLHQRSKCDDICCLYFSYPSNLDSLQDQPESLYTTIENRKFGMAIEMLLAFFASCLLSKLISTTQAI